MSLGKSSNKHSGNTRKKRKERSKFRPTFKDRCVYSFAKNLETMNEIRTLKSSEATDEQIGMAFISCYKYLSHSIEMLCKATLAQRSLYLVLDKIAHFENPYPDEKVLSEKTCTASSAIARASKIFRRKFSNEDLGKLSKILENRNQCEHGDFYIKDFDNEIHFIAPVYKIIAEVYDNQFREGNLIEECKKHVSVECVEIFNRVTDENSTAYKSIANKVKNLTKKGGKFVTCLNCFYPFAQLSKDEKTYECLWCNDTREKRTCTVPTCKKEYWSHKDNKFDKCNSFHLNETATLNLASPFQEASGSSLFSLNLNDSGRNSELTLKSIGLPGQIGESKNILSSIYVSDSWTIQLGKATNPTSDDSENMDSIESKQSTRKKE